MKKTTKEFYIIRSERYLYAVCTCIAEAEGMRKYFGLADFDIHGPFTAKTHEEVVNIVVDNYNLKLDSRMKKIYKHDGKRWGKP